MSDDVDLAIAGDRGTRRYVRSLPRINPGSLKSAALVKTVDFSLLRADFGGREVVFSPWLSLRLVERDRIVSWAAYQPASLDDREEGEPTYPDVAWRRAQWDRFQDADRFRVAPDKAGYLRGDTQIDSRIRFGRLLELPQLAAALREGVGVMAEGVVVHAADRPDVAWDNLRVSVAEKTVMTLDYAPWATRCGEVEIWAERWSTVIDALDDEATVAPDGDITVSYDDSFEELVARTRRFPCPDVDPWLAGEQ